MSTILKTKAITITPTDENDVWEKPWNITLNGETGDEKSVEGLLTDKIIGTVSLAGEKLLGAVPLYVEIEKPYRNQGYGTQVVRLLVDWIFKFSDIYEIKVKTEHVNDSAIHVLSNCGFVFRDGDRITENYSIEKGYTSWLGLYLFLGFVAGIILGVVLAHALIGLAIGMLAGISIGFSMDKTAEAKRTAITGKKKRRKKRTETDKIEL